MKHFLVHDLVHGVWHLDKGILFTLKKAITGPGRVAREYIAGKRAGHFNIITLALLLLGLAFYIQHTFGNPHILLEIIDKHKVSKKYDPSTGIKLIIFSFIPIFSIVAFFFFRKIRFNYTEHIVAATFTLLGVLSLYVIAQTLNFVVTDGFISRYYLDFALAGLFICFAYYQLLHNYYSAAGFVWRMLLTLVAFAFVWLFISLSVYTILGLRGFALVNLPS